MRFLGIPYALDGKSPVSTIRQHKQGYAMKKMPVSPKHHSSFIRMTLSQSRVVLTEHERQVAAAVLLRAAVLSFALTTWGCIYLAGRAGENTAIGHIPICFAGHISLINVQVGTGSVVLPSIS